MRALQRDGPARLRGDVLDARVPSRGGHGAADEERREVRPRGVQRAPAVRREAHGDGGPHRDREGGGGTGGEGDHLWRPGSREEKRCF